MMETDPSTDVADYLAQCRSRFRDESVAVALCRCIADAETAPDDPMPLYRLLRIAQLHGEWDVWKRGAALVLRLPHQTPQTIYYRACAKRRLGDWSGWRDNDARHWGPWAPAPESLCARRLLYTERHCETLSDLCGKTLLVVDEGGFGDTIQWLCFVAPLSHVAKRVILTVKPALLDLVRANINDRADVATDAERLDDQCDEWILSWSVPALFDGLPSFHALKAPHPRSRLQFDTTSLQIGVCWAASDYHLPSTNERRSLHDLAVLEPLLERPGIVWHNLQVGAAARDADRYPSIVQHGLSPETFVDGANLIAGLDGVVTVDTSIAHLAGRLGIPTAVLLPCSSDDRWGFDDTTAWYPTARLMRQIVPGDWASAAAMLTRHIHDEWRPLQGRPELTISRSNRGVVGPSAPP